MLDIHNAALKTVARISFTLGALGCIEEPNSGPELEPDFEPVLDPADAQVTEADVDFVEVADGAMPDAVVVFPKDAGTQADGDFLADAFGGDEDGGADEEADAGIDSEPDMTPEMTDCSQFDDPEDWEAREACCAAAGWNPENDPSCTPWGPPMPPAMPKGVTK